MSWSEPTRRGLIALAGAGLVSGCLRPMLAADGDAASLRGRIALPEIDGRTGYYMTRRLADRLGKAESAEFRLEVDLTLSERDFAIAQDSSVTRRTVTAVGRWRLLPVDGGDPIITGQEVAESGYNESSALYATRVTARDIERRVTEAVADAIARTVLARARTVTDAAAAS